MSVNKVILVGNLGKDPEIRIMQQGGKVASFSVATSKFWKDKQTGERKEKTEWHKISVFNEALTNVVEQFLKKGSKVYIEGEIETRKWQDPSGADRYSTEIVLPRYGGVLIMLDNASQGDQPPRQQSSQPVQHSSAPLDEFEDDIPF